MIGTRIPRHPLARQAYLDAAEYCRTHDAYIEAHDDYFEVVAAPPRPVTRQDYDDAMEAHLLAERIARGYTLREPSEHTGSSIPRLAADAADWIAHRDAVFLYALGVQEHYAQTGEAPDLEQFKAALPVITWSWTEEEAETQTEGEEA